ncbi:MAG: nucleoside deaminase [Planctomycetota bacterium]
MHDDAHYMQLALDACRAGVEKGQSPFGAAIVSADGELLAVEHNTCRSDKDPTAHAEVQAIRAACQKVQHRYLDGATVYATTEPCPMCFTASHWASVKRIVYAASIADAARFGFRQLEISTDQLKTLGRADMEIVPDFMRDASVALFELWSEKNGSLS